MCEQHGTFIVLVSLNIKGEMKECNIDRYTELHVLMDGWMNCNFTSFSTVFQSYQDDERLIMKGCVQWNPVMFEKKLPQVGLKLGTARSAGLLNPLSYWSSSTF